LLEVARTVTGAPFGKVEDRQGSAGLDLELAILDGNLKIEIGPRP
jgi:hypothetical protein